MPPLSLFSFTDAAPFCTPAWIGLSSFLFEIIIGDETKPGGLKIRSKQSINSW